MSVFNSFLPSGLSHPYQMKESICKFRGVWCTFHILILFLTETPASKQCGQRLRSAASDLGLQC